MSRILCAALALTLILTSAACLAEAQPEPTPIPVYERETVIAGCEQLDDAIRFKTTMTKTVRIIAPICIVCAVTRDILLEIFLFFLIFNSPSLR